MLDLVLYFLLRSFAFLINLFPYYIRIKILSFLINFIFYLKPKYKKIALKNLNLAFPEKDFTWKERTYKDSLNSLAQVVVDCLAIPQISKDLASGKIEAEGFEDFKKAREKIEGPVICLSGHINSFELIAIFYTHYSRKLTIVIRKFKNKAANTWWNHIRSTNGAGQINKDGAFKEIKRTLKRGEDVGILYDQNIIGGQAVFVPLFGKLAATTRSVSLLVCSSKPKPKVVVVRLDGDYIKGYKLKYHFFDFDHIVGDSSIDLNKKTELITTDLNIKLEELIRETPTGWFWIHRRWKTRPEGEAEDFYD